MKTSLEYASLSIPFVYVMALSGIALHGWSRSPISSPPGLMPLIAFLLMAFFFSAISMQNHISRLEKRIASLEKQFGRKTDETSS